MAERLHDWLAAEPFVGGHAGMGPAKATADSRPERRCSRAEAELREEVGAYRGSRVPTRACPGACIVASPGPLAVLVVEDDDVLLHDLRQSLADLGCDAVGVASMDEAMAQAAERRPDLALVDIRVKARHNGTSVRLPKGIVDVLPGGGFYADLQGLEGNPIYPADGFLGEGPCRAIRMANGKQPGLNLLFAVVLARLAVRQTSQGERERQEVEELTIAVLLIGRIRHG